MMLKLRNHKFILSLLLSGSSVSPFLEIFDLNTFVILMLPPMRLLGQILFVLFCYAIVVG